MEGSFEFDFSQEQLSSQNFVLVKSASPKHCTRITAREETLLAIHIKIKAHLKNEKPLTKIELYKLQTILKRMQCSSPRDQKAAQLARDILKSIHSQTSKKVFLEPLLQQNSSSTSLKSSATNETQTSESTSKNGPISRQIDSREQLDPMSVSTDSDVKGQLFDGRSESSYKTDKLKYPFTENASIPLQTEHREQLDPMSVSTDSDVKGQLFDGRSESSYKTDKLKYPFTENASIPLQTEHREQLDPMSVSTDSDVNSQLFDRRSESSYKTDKLKYPFTENASKPLQTEPREQFDSMSVSTDSDVKGQLFDKRSEPSYKTNKLKYPFTEIASKSRQSEPREQLDPMSVSTDSDVNGQLFDERSETSRKTDKNLKYHFTENATKSNPNRSNILSNESRASNIFSGQGMAGDEKLSLVKETTLSNYSDSATNIASSRASHKRRGTPFTFNYNSEKEVAPPRHDMSINFNHNSNGHVNSDVKVPRPRHDMTLNFNSARDTPAPFTVPTLLDKGVHSGVSTQSNVLKLKYDDVKFDSDSISIPLELLTNPNFGSGSGQSQGADCKDNPPVLSDFTEKNSAIGINTSSSKSSFSNPINKDLSQNQYKFTQSDLSTNEDSSLKTNNIESVKSHGDFPYTTSENRHGEKITWATTPKNQVNTLTISSFSTNVEAPILNIDMGTTNTETPSWNELFNVKEVLFASPNDKFGVENTKLHTKELLHVGDTRCSSRKKAPTNVNSDSYVKRWYEPGAAENKNMDTETPDLDHFVPLQDSMEICKSFTDEQGDLEMTDAERRYLETAATSSETNVLIFDQNIINKNQTNGSESEEDSFEFNLDTDRASDIVEATQLDDLKNKTFHNKIKTLLPKKQDIQVSAPSQIIIGETQDIIIDETPCSMSESPANYQYNESVPQSLKVVPRDQTSFSKQHTLFNPYKKWPRANSFQEMYKSNYQRKSPGATSRSSKINILKNVQVNKEDVAQSQSLDNVISKEKLFEEYKTVVSSANNFIYLGDSLSFSQVTNNRLTKTAPPITNDTSEKQSNSSKFQKMAPSENIILIDGTNPENTEEMDTAQAESEEETFEEKDKKLVEEITRKRNKHRDSWNDKPVAEKVSLKYVRKFGVNIYEDPANSLMNIDYKVNVNNFHFRRLTMKEMNEKLKKSNEKVTIFNEALTKMIDTQISSSTEENYQFKTARDAADSDSSDEDEQSKKKRVLEEIRLMARLETKTFLEDMEKERKEELRLGKNDDDKENETEKLTDEEETRRLVELLRQAEDCSWLK